MQVRRVSELDSLRRRLKVALGTLVTVTLVGVIGYSVIGRGTHSLIDAVYMTVITLTTVGYGEIIDMSHSPGGRIFTMFLLLGGIGVVAYAMPTLTAFLIEGDLNHLFTRRRMQKKIDDMNNHYVVCGDGTVAAYVTEELAKSGRQVVFVGGSERALAMVPADVPGFGGDTSDDTVLTDAGIQRAAGVVACMDNDKENILVVLAARRLAPKARIIASTERAETEAKLRAVGADAIVSPTRIGGLRMASELVRPAVVSFLDHMLRAKEANLRVEEVSVGADVAAGATLADLRIDEVPGAVLLAVRQEHSDAFEFKPPVTTTLTPGLTLVLMVDSSGRERLHARIHGRSSGGGLANP
jgi:voltage-gated potassium channel